MLEETCLLVPMACDLTDQGRKLGPESEWCLVKAYGVYIRKRTMGQNVLFISGAGMAPRTIFPGQTMAMFFLQQQYLSQQGVPDNCLHSPIKPRWGSRAEMEEAMLHAKTIKGEIEIIFVSSWYHIPRLRLLLWQYRRKGVLPKATIRFVASRGRFINALKEPPKLLAQFFWLA